MTMAMLLPHGLIALLRNTDAIVSGGRFGTRFHHSNVIMKSPLCASSLIRSGRLERFIGVTEFRPGPSQSRRQGVHAAPAVIRHEAGLKLIIWHLGEEGRSAR